MNSHVFPLVGSIKVSPGLILPNLSASSIIRSAIRSLTLPPALKNSSFAYTAASIPRLWGIRLSLTIGELPICSVMASMTTGGIFGMVMVDVTWQPVKLDFITVWLSCKRRIVSARKGIFLSRYHAGNKWMAMRAGQFSPKVSCTQQDFFVMLRAVNYSPRDLAAINCRLDS